jgi:internalin A
MDLFYCFGSGIRLIHILAPFLSHRQILVLVTIHSRFKPFRRVVVQRLDSCCVDNYILLDGQRIKRIGEDMCHMKNVTWLSLSENLDLILPDKLFVHMSQLSTLELVTIGLTQLPSSLTALTKLSRLALGHNKLAHIDLQLNRLANLRTLDLKNNQITEIPTEMATLTKLKILRLDHNQLTWIPTELSTLSRLEVLQVMNNRLTWIAPELAELTRHKLRRFCLWGNPVQKKSVPLEIWKISP